MADRVLERYDRIYDELLQGPHLAHAHNVAALLTIAASVDDLTDELASLRKMQRVHWLAGDFHVPQSRKEK